MPTQQPSDKDNISRKQFFRKWLEQLQQESWQLELLISGFALFGIYEGKSWIDDLILGLSNNTYSSAGSLVAFLEVLLECGWTIFFINLLIHVILRGLWIGAIGLRYVSQDIDYNSLDYSTRFTQYLRKQVGDYDDFIERLERFCSILFAYTFLLFLLLLSLLLFFSLYWLSMILAIKLGSSSQPEGWLIGLGLVYLVLGFIVFIDFATLGAFKKIEEPTVSKIYLWLYKFYSTITLSFLYRPLLYNFIDDKYTKRLFYLSIPYIFIVLFSNKLISNNPYPYWSDSTADEHGMSIHKINYEDERKRWYSENSMKRELTKERLPLMTLSKLKLDEQYLEIYLRMLGDDQYLLSDIDSLVPFTKPGFRFSLFSDNTVQDPTAEKIMEERRFKTKPYRDQRKQIRKMRVRGIADPQGRAKIDSLTVIVDSINKLYETRLSTFEANKVSGTISTLLSHAWLSLDGQPINSDLDCYMYRHPNFGEHGLLCMYNTDSLAMGKHTLSLRRDTYRDSGEEIRLRTMEVPFYKVR